MPEKCEFCLGVHSGTKDKCPLCGRGLIHCLPEREDIYLQAADIRKGWPICRIRACELYEQAKVARGRTIKDGMLRRDKWDGRED